MAHTYAHLYGVPSTGLRFFYRFQPVGTSGHGPFSFLHAPYLAREPIKIFNNGLMSRDFTYIDYVVEAILRLIDHPPVADAKWDRPKPDPSTSFALYRIYNVGNNHPVQLLEFVSAIEDCLQMKAQKEFLPMQPGDVQMTCADIEDIVRDFGYGPETPLRQGISRFVAWYKQYYGSGSHRFWWPLPFCFRKKGFHDSGKLDRLTTKLQSRRALHSRSWKFLQVRFRPAASFFIHSGPPRYICLNDFRSPLCFPLFGDSKITHTILAQAVSSNLQ
jgi:hypothetical protein